MYLVFTRMPTESYRRRLRPLLLYLCYVFRAQINSLVGRLNTSALGLVLFQIYVEPSLSQVNHSQKSHRVFVYCWQKWGNIDQKEYLPQYSYRGRSKQECSRLNVEPGPKPHSVCQAEALMITRTTGPYLTKIIM